MQQPSHQTIKLKRGRHTSPHYGACVMELASMLAGEPFSDQPRSVSPTLAAFLRTFNDMLDDERRQALYSVAARSVGTAGSFRTELLRAERLTDWGHAMRQRRLHSRLIGKFRSRMQAKRISTPAAAAHYAASAIRKRSDKDHAAALALIDELIAMAPTSSFASAPGSSRDPPVIGRLMSPACTDGGGITPRRHRPGLRAPGLLGRRSSHLRR